MAHTTADKLETALKLLRRLVKVVDTMHHEIHRIDERLTVMQSAMDELKDKVARLTTVTGSVKALIADLVAKINAAPTLEEVRKITAEVSANVDALSEAVPANTPAEQ